MKKAVLPLFIGFLLGAAALSTWWLFTGSDSRQELLLPPEEKSYIRYTLYRGAIRDEKSYRAVVQAGDESVIQISMPSKGFVPYARPGMVVPKADKLYKSGSKVITAKQNSFIISVESAGSETRLTMLNLDKTYATALIPFADLPSVYAYPALSVSGNRTEVPGEIVFVSPQTVLAGDDYCVEAHVAFTGLGCLPNTPVELIFSGAGSEDTLFISKEAVFYIDGIAHLRFADEEGRLLEFPVTTGYSNRSGYIQVFAPELVEGSIYLGEVTYGP